MSTRSNLECRSKKHSLGGCGDPRCPEGMHLGSLMQQALASGNLDSVYDQVERTRLKAVYASKPDYENSGFAELVVIDPQTEKEAKVRLAPKRPEWRAAAEAVDRSVVHDFDSVSELNQYVRNNYPQGVAYHASESTPNEWEQWGDLHVQQITIDADLRGLGISSHFRRMLTKYADKKGYFISGTPTNRGDGSTVDDQDADHRERALKHRQRLVNSYYRSGYVDNPFWHDSSPKGDWLTGEFTVHDSFTAENFTPEAARYLGKQGQYIRFPNGAVPKGMLKRGRTFDATGYRAPAPAATKAEASKRYSEIYDVMLERIHTEQAERKAKRDARKSVAA